jgi:hypothetical protein
MGLIIFFMVFTFTANFLHPEVMSGPGAAKRVKFNQSSKRKEP